MHPFRKPFPLLLLTGVLFCFGVNAQTKHATKLILFVSKDRYGMATPDKHIVVPCKYVDVMFTTKYFALQDTSEAWHLYSSTGSFLAKADRIMLNEDRRPLLLDNIEDTASRVLNLFNSTYGDSLTYSFWYSIAPSKLTIVDTNNNLVHIPGTACVMTDPLQPTAMDGTRILAAATVNAAPQFVVIQEDNKTGIYNVDEMRYTIPPDFSAIECRPLGVFVTVDPSGKKQMFNLAGTELIYEDDYDQGKIIPFGKQLNKNTNITEPHYTQNVSPIWYEMDDYDPLDHSNRKPLAYMKRHSNDKSRGNAFDLVSTLDSSVLIKDIRNSENTTLNSDFTQDLSIISRYDTIIHLVMPIGVYSVTQRRFVFPFADHEAKYDADNGLVKVKKNKVTYYYSFAGALLGSIADSISSWQKPWELFHRYDMENKYQHRRNMTHYFAIRSERHEKYKLYGLDDKLVDSSFEELFEPYSNGYIAFKKNGKWGLFDKYFNEVLPPVYDPSYFFYNPIQAYQKMAYVMKDSVRYYVDLKNSTLFCRHNFSYIDEHPANGKWLAMDFYEPKVKPRFGESIPPPQVKAVYIIDSSGNKLDTWECTDDKNTRYQLTWEGKILCHPKDRNEYGYGAVNNNWTMYDPKTKTSTLFPGKNPSGVVQYKGIPILISCTSEDKGEALFSVKDFKPVIPFNKHLFYRSTEMTFDDANATYQGVLIRGVDKNERIKIEKAADIYKNPSGETEDIIGFYNFNGTLYSK